MFTVNLSVALTAAGLLLAAPAYAQTSPQKQHTQEGGISVPAGSNTGIKQQTQEGGLSVPAGPNTGLKQQTQEGGLSVPPTSR
jgi:peptide deformylase